MDHRQSDLLKWASNNARVPWEKMVEAAAKISKGEQLDNQSAETPMPLTPFIADYRQLYPLMRAFTGLITWSPNNLFTIILDADGKKILRAYLEVTRDHNFISLIPINPDEPFMKEALEIIKTGDLYPLRRYLDDQCKSSLKHGVNWVKIANLEFFGAFKEQMSDFEKSGDLWDWIIGSFKAVKNIYENRLIDFTPEPPVFARLRELFSGILQIDLDHIDFKSIFGKIDINSPDKKEIVVLLADHKDIIGLSIGGKEPMKITLDPAITQELKSMSLPFHKLAKQACKLTGANLVIALRIEPVANLVYDALYNEMPYSRENTKGVLRKLIEIIRRFRELWTIYPLPFYLSDPVRLPAKWLGNPYDINYLASWFLPGVIIDGEAIFLGQHNVRTFVTMDDDRIIAIYTLESYDAGIRKVITHDPEKYAHIFAGMKPDYDDVKTRAIALGINLWNEGYGFQNQVMITQSDFLKTLGQASSIEIWKNPLKLWRVIKPGKKLVKQLKGGAIVTYPDQMLVSLENWVKKVGRLKIYRPLLSVPFDRKRPRSRGVKYVKPTIFTALAMGAGLLIYFLNVG